MNWKIDIGKILMWRLVLVDYNRLFEGSCGCLVVVVVGDYLVVVQVMMILVNDIGFDFVFFGFIVELWCQQLCILFYCCDWEVVIMFCVFFLVKKGEGWVCLFLFYVSFGKLGEILIYEDIIDNN